MVKCHSLCALFEHMWPVKLVGFCVEAATTVFGRHVCLSLASAICKVVGTVYRQVLVFTTSSAPWSAISEASQYPQDWRKLNGLSANLYLAVDLCLRIEGIYLAFLLSNSDRNLKGLVQACRLRIKAIRQLLLLRAEHMVYHVSSSQARIPYRIKQEGVLKIMRTIVQCEKKLLKVSLF